jgi:hypothetical protein
MENRNGLKEMVTYVDNTKPYIPPEERKYLVCLQDTDVGARDWDIIVGRMETYEYLKERINYIDLSRSFVLVETVRFADRISVYKFLKTVGDNVEDNFDITEYVKGDWNEEDFQNNRLDSSLMVSDPFKVDNSQRINMEDIMNGYVETNNLDEEDEE